LLGRLGTELSHFQAIILQDYNKGVLTPEVIRSILDACKNAKIPVGVDPKRENFWAYTGVALFKPNLRELETALARRLPDEAALLEAAPEVAARLEAKYLLVTRGEKGMMLFADNQGEFIPTQTKRVHDVSGAGDTVIATIMAALAAGANVHEAATLANHAASVVIAEVGAVPVDPVKLRRACMGR
ncbi:MAG: PfkB family carbohydrate kinase, partial [Calditrichota bacterium]